MASVHDVCYEGQTATNGDATQWTLALTTLAGEDVEVQALPLGTVYELALLARQRLGTTDAITFIFGETLLDHSKTLQASGLYDGACIYLRCTWECAFRKTVVPRFIGKMSLLLHPADGCADPTFTTVAKFGSGAESYRCAIGDALPDSGCQTVVFDCTEYQGFGALGVHTDPEAMGDSPLGDRGWIGETEGGVCLYHDESVLHNNKFLHRDANYAHMLRAGSSISMEIDHSAKVISWTEVRKVSKCRRTRSSAGIQTVRRKVVIQEFKKISVALPDNLVGRSLFPVVSFTKGSEAKVQIRSPA